MHERQSRHFLATQLRDSWFMTVPLPEVLSRLFPRDAAASARGPLPPLPEFHRCLCPTSAAASARHPLPPLPDVRCRLC